MISTGDNSTGAPETLRCDACIHNERKCSICGWRLAKIKINPHFLISVCGDVGSTWVKNLWRKHHHVRAACSAGGAPAPENDTLGPGPSSGLLSTGDMPKDPGGGLTRQMALSPALTAIPTRTRLCTQGSPLRRLFGRPELPASLLVGHF